MDPKLAMAVEAFRTFERRRLAADAAEAELLEAVQALALVRDASLSIEYFRLTNEILSEFDAKREKAGLT